VGKGKLNEWQVLWVDISRLDDGFVSGSGRLFVGLFRNSYLA